MVEEMAAPHPTPYNSVSNPLYDPYLPPLSASPQWMVEEMAAKREEEDEWKKQFRSYAAKKDKVP